MNVGIGRGGLLRGGGKVGKGGETLRWRACFGYRLNEST